jgi:uncharacterized cupin superfamily protein
MTSSITKLVDCTATPITEDLEGWVKVEGNPTMTTWIEYTKEDGSIISGCWEATPGTYRAVYKSWEYIHMLQGKVIITPDDGEPVTVMAGDAFVIEDGFKGTWEIQEKVFKHFVIRL